MGTFTTTTTGAFRTSRTASRGCFAVLPRPGQDLGPLIWIDEGEPGYRLCEGAGHTTVSTKDERLDIWDEVFSESQVVELNAELGIDKDTAARIVLSSMRGTPMWDKA